MYRVKLGIFKSTGKWYTDGSYVSKEGSLYEVWDEVRLMQRECRLPGLAPGADQTKFIVYVETPDFPEEAAHLILPGVGKVLHDVLLCAPYRAVNGELITNVQVDGIVIGTLEFDDDHKVFVRLPGHAGWTPRFSSLERLLVYLRSERE
jgi:hypothetical protein